MTERNVLFVSADQRRTTINEIVEVGLLTQEYLLLLILSAVIVVTGLLMNSAAVIIGGMVTAPLLSPMLTMAMGVVLADFKLIRKSTITIAVSVGAVLAFGTLLTLFHPSASMNSELLERSGASLTHLIIAIAAGVLAAFAFVRPHISQTITGIAVSVALLPPVASAGIGIAFLNWSLFSGALALFFVNLLGIVLSATVVFSLMGFYSARRQAEQKLQEEEQRAVEDKKSAAKE